MAGVVDEHIVRPRRLADGFPIFAVDGQYAGVPADFGGCTIDLEANAIIEIAGALSRSNSTIWRKISMSASNRLDLRCRSCRDKGHR